MQNKRTWLNRRSSAKSVGCQLNVDIPDITLAKWHTTARTFPVPDLQVPLNARATEQVVTFCDDNLQESLTASNESRVYLRDKGMAVWKALEYKSKM